MPAQDVIELYLADRIAKEGKREQIDLPGDICWLPCGDTLPLNKETPVNPDGSPRFDGNFSVIQTGDNTYVHKDCSGKWVEFRP